MNDIAIRGLAFALAAGLSALACGQQVHRCELADGSTVFSDLPCESDIGVEDTVDAMPHQGHRAPPGRPGRELGRPNADSPHAERPTARPPAPTLDEPSDPELSRRERLSLERERKQLLSGLKRRHVDAADRREMIRDLRKIDRKLGIGPADVADMPFHDREVYLERRVYPGASGTVGR